MSKIVTALTEGATSFTYKKTNGETRQARGTLNPSLMPTSEQSKTVDTSGERVNYWDLDAADWRQFRVASVEDTSIKQG